MECEVHKKIFHAAVGFGPLTRTIPHENSKINDLDMQHRNAPKGYSVIRYSVGNTCPDANWEKGVKNDKCKMEQWKFIQVITEEDYKKL